MVVIPLYGPASHRINRRECARRTNLPGSHAASATDHPTIAAALHTPPSTAGCKEFRVNPAALLAF
jgi:hypothetical protein